MSHNTFDDYQKQTSALNMGPPKQLPSMAYYALAVNGEAGELAEEVKKLYRDHDGVLTDEWRDAMVSEAGDVLWYLVRFCETLGVSFSEMAGWNITKLEGRRGRGTIQGSGDKR